MTCQSCESFASNRQTGSYNANCMDCDARHLSQSPVYFDAVKAGAITDAYKWALKNIVGDGDWKTLHLRVKHYSGLIRGEAA